MLDWKFWKSKRKDIDDLFVLVNQNYNKIVDLEELEKRFESLENNNKLLKQQMIEAHKKLDKLKQKYFEVENDPFEYDDKGNLINIKVTNQM